MNNIPFDQYQRYKTTELIINDLRKEDEKLTILEIGANEHKNLELFLPIDQIRYLDINLPEALKEDPQYIHADATSMPEIETDSVDIVVALDVFEHIPGNLRESFLCEINRVAKQAFILAGPFDEAGVNKAEIRVNEYFKMKHGADYIWLEEHIKNGLPVLSETKHTLESNLRKKTVHFKHGSLELWEQLIRLHFEVAADKGMQEYRQLVDNYYNENIFFQDVNDNCYRDFIICSDDEINIKNYFHYSAEHESILNSLIESTYRLSVEKRLTSIQEKDTHIHTQEQQLQEKDTHIHTQEQQLQEKDTHIHTQEQQLQALSLKNRMKRLFRLHKPEGFYRKELPNSFAIKFDRSGYLNANQDVENAIKNGIVKSAFKHFCDSGFDEIKRGDRKLLEALPLYNDADYTNTREDVTQAIDKGEFKHSHFVHYLLYGHKEILKQNKWKILKHIKSNPSSVKLGFRVLRKQGFKSLIQKIKRVSASTNAVESNIYKYIEPELTDEIKGELNGFINKPLISIIMPVYNVDPKWLDLAIKSIESQWYKNWELCIADDKSRNKKTLKYLKAIENSKVTVKFLKKNGNISIASNEALSLTSGEYIALMDNDDELTPDALYEVVKAINEHDAEFIYSDEDKLEMDGTFSDPHFKPDFAPDMFLSQNYLSHLGVIKKELVTKVNGFTVGLEGAQDYDLYLKVLEHTNKTHHIQKVLYHWRKILGSTAMEFGEKSYAQEAGRHALEFAMQRRNIKAVVKNGLTVGTYKVEYEIFGNPLVSIIIPFKDKPELLKMCIESILDKSTYSNFEIIGISNNSEDEKTFVEMKRLKAFDHRVEFYEYNVAFNYSDINNHAVKMYAKGEHLLFLNNDIEIITPEWIEELLTHSQRIDVGAVGAKLYFPDDTVQHAGLVIAPYTAHVIISMYRGVLKEEYGYVSRAKCINNYLAVTAACLMCKKSIFEEIGGFDSKSLAVAYNDVDLCLTLSEAGYLNVFTPYCEAYHYESISRGYEESVSQIERREKEKAIVKEKHSLLFENGDPYYNRNLTLFSSGSQVASETSMSYLDFIGLPWTEETIFEKGLNAKSKTRMCLFSHYDKENKISEYVIFYLKELSKIADIIFISTAEKLTSQEIDKVSSICRGILIKKNYGYDFGAWKSGLKVLAGEIDDYEELILCNDSVFGPFYNLNTIFMNMKDRYDIWAMTDNAQINYHLQSYFIVYNKAAFQHKVFQDFWSGFEIYNNKQKLIEINEVKFSKKLQETELRIGAFCTVDDYSYLNITHYYWKELILNKQFPFIKKELLRDNPMGIDILGWEEVVESISNYDVKLILESQL